LLLTLLDSTGIINEGVKAVYDTIGRIKGTRLKHDEIAEYVGDKNSNLDGIPLSFLLAYFLCNKPIYI
jgi:hypothetical protein